jgi:hypothetical protein
MKNKNLFLSPEIIEETGEMQRQDNFRTMTHASSSAFKNHEFMTPKINKLSLQF